MGFGRELKDFVSGFQSGWKLVEDSEEAKDRRESRKIDRESKKLDMEEKRQEMDLKAGARRAFTGAGGADNVPGQNPEVSGFDKDGNPVPASTGGGGYNEAGKLPTFAAVAPRLVDDLSKDFGLKGWQAEGLVGSLAHESGGFGNMQEDKPMVPGSRGGYGYAQWTGPRRRQFEAWVKENGLDINSYEANYGFLKHELQNTPEGKILAGLRQAPDAITSARLFTDGFLRPGIPHMDSRYKWTNRVASIRKGDPSTTTARAATPTAPTMTAGASPALPIQPAATGANSPEEIDKILANPSAYDPGTVEWARAKKAGGGAATVQTASYAEGGLVEEELPQRVSAVPVNLTGDSAETPDAVRRNPQSGQSPAAPTREVRQSDLTSLDTIPEAVDMGMKFISHAFGFDQPAPAIGAVNPQRSQRLEAFANHAGAAEPEEMEAIEKTVDPNGKMTDDQRYIAGYNAVYKYWMEQGEPEKAKRALGGMLMAQKRAISMDGTMARAAYEAGDIPGMVDAVIAGKNRIPDGESVRATKITPQGVEFEIVDNNGKVKQKGRASIEDMVNLSNQMVSGAAWFDQVSAIKALSPAQKLAEEKDRREQEEGKARDEFESSQIGNESEFVSTLSPEDLEKYNKMGRKDKNDFRRQFENKRKAEAVQKRTEDAAATAAEKEQWKRDFSIFKESVTQGRWEADRERIMTNDERRLAMQMLEEEGRNNRHNQSQEWRRERQLEIDQRILEKRKGSEKQLGVGKTAGERKEQAIDLGVQQAENAEWNTLGGAEGPLLPEQHEHLRGVKVGAAYGKATMGNKPDRQRIDADAEQFGEIFDSEFKAAGIQLDPVNKMTFVNTANSIREGNPTVTVQEAALLARTMADPRANPQVLEDGRVSVHPRLPPIRVSPDALAQMQNIRRANGNPEKAITPSGNPGTPAATSALNLVPGGAPASRAMAQQAVPGGSAAPPQAPGNTSNYVKSTAQIEREAEDEAKRTAYSAQQTRNAEAAQLRKNESKETERQKLIGVIGQEEYDAMVARAPGGVVTLRDLRRAAEEIPIARQQSEYRKRRQNQNKALRGIPIN